MPTSMLTLMTLDNWGNCYKLLCRKSQRYMRHNKGINDWYWASYKLFEAARGSLSCNKYILKLLQMTSKIKRELEALNLICMPINWYCNGIRIKRKGFDIVLPNGGILYTFQPVNYSNGDRRLVTSFGLPNRYIKRLSLKGLDLTPRETYSRRTIGDQKHEYTYTKWVSIY